jgi:DNA mismatch repair protein MutL
MPIHILPLEIASRIAAGEVVERPASVVKELIENAIDAGAIDIKIEVRQGGQRLIRVIDNGSGIPAAEVELAFQRYATSKLEHADDLFRIRSLGFRGEALPSIAAVSQVTMLTRAAGEPIGTFVRLENGAIVRREKRGAPPGTVVTVENLFYNVPARRKFLKSETTESSHIADLVASYAMAYPKLRFSLLSDGRMALQSPGSGELYDMLVKVYGLEVAQQMLPVAASDHPASNVQVSGFVGAPSIHRSTRKYITFFVNGRWIQDRSLAYAVEEAYHTLLPTGRHPIVVLNITLDSEEVDVNVHPTKGEVRFRQGREVFAVVQRAVRHTLTTGAPVPLVSRPTVPTPFAEPRQPRRLIDVGRGGRATRGEMALEVQRTAPAPPPFLQAGEGAGATRLPMLRVLGQMSQAYIVAEGPEGMYLIDQHAAHERVLYERLQAERAPLTVASQGLLEPQVIELLPRQHEVIEVNRETLARLGFSIEPFG